MEIILLSDVDGLGVAGDIVKVIVLGVIPMIDDGETDWKIISIRKDDPLSKKLNDINDVNILIIIWGIYDKKIFYLRIYFFFFS